MSEKDNHFWVCELANRLPIDVLPPTPSWNALLGAVVALREDRDGLAAQVMRFQIAAETVECVLANSNFAVDGLDELQEVLEETPAQSLEAMKSQWQASGALMFAEHVFKKHRYDFIDWAKTYAAEVRQRTQENSDE